MERCDRNSKKKNVLYDLLSEYICVYARIMKIKKMLCYKALNLSLINLKPYQFTVKDLSDCSKVTKNDIITCDLKELESKKKFVQWGAIAPCTTSHL